MGLLLLPVFALLQLRATLLGAQAAPNGQASSLCRDEEQIIFSCDATPGGRIISLCASKNLDHRRGYLQYRYGKPGTIELQFPQARANTQLAFRYAHYFRAQVDRTEISFDSQDDRYILFDYYEGDVKPAISTAGVRINKLGTTGREVKLLCHGKPTSELGRLETVVTRDHDNALNQ